VNDSEISDLAWQMPAPVARDLPSGRQQILKEHLMTEFRLAQQTGAGAPPPNRRRRRHFRYPLLAVGTGVFVLAAAVALAVSIVLPGGKVPGATGPTASGPSSAKTGPAIVLLDKIAAAAERQSPQQVTDSEFMYIRSEVAYEVDSISNGHETSVMQKPHERQIWLPAGSSCVAGLLIEDGSSTPLGGQGPVRHAAGLAGQPQPARSVGRTPDDTKGCGLGNLAAPTYRLLQSLPTDPRALLNIIYAQTKGEGPSPNAEAFTTIGDLIREAIVPPNTAAALYRAAGLIPGVIVINNVRDAVGRPGVAVAWRTGGHFVDAWIFNRGTLQYLGERDYDTVTGRVGGESAVLQRAFVAKPGMLP
jgi:hypothetical protein